MLFFSIISALYTILMVVCAIACPILPFQLLFGFFAMVGLVLTIVAWRDR